METQLTGDLAKDLSLLEKPLLLHSLDGAHANAKQFMKSRISLAAALESYAPTAKFKGRTTVLQPTPLKGDRGEVILHDGIDFREVSILHPTGQIQRISTVQQYINSFRGFPHILLIFIAL